VWSRDGRWIYFASTRNDRVRAGRAGTIQGALAPEGAIWRDVRSLGTNSRIPWIGGIGFQGHRHLPLGHSSRRKSGRNSRFPHFDADSLCQCNRKCNDRDSAGRHATDTYSRPSIMRPPITARNRHFRRWPKEDLFVGTRTKGDGDRQVASDLRIASRHRRSHCQPLDSRHFR